MKGSLLSLGLRTDAAGLFRAIIVLNVKLFAVSAVHKSD
jgi:hypothetical protein